MLLRLRLYIVDIYKDEFRRNLRSHSWSVYSFFIKCSQDGENGVTWTVEEVT